MHKVSISVSGKSTDKNIFLEKFKKLTVRHAKNVSGLIPPTQGSRVNLFGRNDTLLSRGWQTYYFDTYQLDNSGWQQQ